MFDRGQRGSIDRSELALLLSKLNLKLDSRNVPSRGVPRRVSFDDLRFFVGRCAIKDSDISMDFAVSVAVSNRSPLARGSIMQGTVWRTQGTVSKGTGGSGTEFGVEQRGGEAEMP